MDVTLKAGNFWPEAISPENLINNGLIYVECEFTCSNEKTQA